jgi:phospholipid/cholesterol/gamma-HCH transport system substrate-binding protein
MENRANALATGLFVVLLLALLIVGAIWLSGGTFKGVPYDLVTEQSVAGLEPGAPVRLRGIDVGHVQSVGFDPQDRRLVLVRVLIDADVPLMAGTRATVTYLGLSGTDYVELDYPDSASRLLVTSQHAPAQIPMSRSGMAALTESGDQLLGTLRVTLEHLNAILTPETAKNFHRLLVQLNAAAVQLTTLERDLRPAAQRTDRLLADSDQVMRSARTTLQDADTLIVQVRARVGALDAVRDGARDAGEAAQDVDRALVDQTLPQISMLSDRLARNSDSLELLLRELRAQPQSLIFGPPAAQPGPGEPGFHEPQR